MPDNYEGAYEKWAKENGKSTTKLHMKAILSQPTVEDDDDDDLREAEKPSASSEKSCNSAVLNPVAINALHLAHALSPVDHRLPTQPALGSLRRMTPRRRTTHLFAAHVTLMRISLCHTWARWLTKSALGLRRAKRRRRKSHTSPSCTLRTVSSNRDRQKTDRQNRRIY